LIAVVYPGRGDGVDAIADHAALLAGALGPHHPATVVPWTGRRSFRRDLDRAGADSVLLEYNPFSYGRGGLAPGLVAACASLRRSPRRRLFLFVHEATVPPEGVKGTLMHGGQRAQLEALGRLSDRVFITIEGWRSRLPRPRRQGALCVPSGSTIPDGRASRDRMREEIGAGSDLVVALFGGTHPSRPRAAIDAALAKLRQSVEGLSVLNLGASAPAVGQADGMRTVEPGMVSAPQLADLIAAADMMLLPFTDGASLRRTTLAAALQHAVPVVTTRGFLTDRLLVDEPAGVAFAPADSPEDFADLAAVVARDGERRSRMSADARAFYDAQLAWPVLGERVARGMGVA
jgi:glycosyltransferase involved in cell wall biosynthesis